MDLITWLSPASKTSDLPDEFPSPFNNIPHAIARQAAEQLQARLTNQADWAHDFDAIDGGKMFGVLVVKDSDDRIGFLSAFAGMLAGQWQLPGFVPPIFDRVQRESLLSAAEAELARYDKQIAALQHNTEQHDLQVKLHQLTQQQDAETKAMRQEHKSRQMLRREQRMQAKNEKAEEQASLFAKLAFESQQDKRELQSLNAHWRMRLEEVQGKLDDTEAQIEYLKTARANFSSSLHKQLYSTYTLSNRLGEVRTISHFFKDHNPPASAGDCAAPKLIHYAHKLDLLPLALTEFWWGAPPKHEVRHHGHHYPACRGKCRPILPFMLKGLKLQPAPLLAHSFHDVNVPETIYEDDDLIIVNKPSGLLSVPGEEVQDSVLTWLQQRYPNATGPMLVHRLDMSTSGLLLAAKNAETHKSLQQQFERRSVEKRYVAVLSAMLSQHQDKGNIELPLCVDIHDRPRQVVCFAHGKATQTRWQVIARQSTTTRVYFYPKTGRTHQLRIHAAHKDGLNAPIVGDELYYQAGERLLLHAERLRFTHPATGKWIEVNSPVPF